MAVDFSNIIVRDTLFCDLEDEEICMNVLGQTRQDVSLNEMLQHVEVKERGKRSAGRLHADGATTTAAATSSYKRRERHKMQP